MSFHIALQFEDGVSRTIACKPSELVSDAAYKAKIGQDFVEEDRMEGEKLDISGTPAVFVNGRYMNPYLFGGTITGWIDDALRR